MKFAFRRGIILLPLILIFLNNTLPAQSIGFDFGIAGAENYGKPNASFGISLMMPFNDKLEGILSYNEWRGEDGNYTLAKKGSTNGITYLYGSFYGNKGLHFALNYKYFSSEKFSLLFGAGLSQFEMIELNYTINKLFIGALTIIPLQAKYSLNERLSITIKGSLSSKTTHLVPDWGLLTTGIEYKPF